MRRVALAGAVIGLAILGTGAFVLTRGGEEPVHAPAPARGPVAQAPQGPPAPQVPMAGRIAISPAQLREASAAGLVDRPIRSILDVRGPKHYRDFVWNDKGVPDGPTWIRVDLAAQLISVFRSGHEIGTAVILYGTDGYPTPTGKFPILAKLKDHKSSTYDDAPMPYTLRLTGDGVSIHGSNVRWGLASHGCVGVPKDFAAKLFDVVNKGDEVLIVSGKAKPTPA
jgi:lipoprotein-anchoring transpeptidase ErfK/SrfK